MKSKESEFYSLREVMNMLGISSRTATNWLKEGRFTGAHRVDSNRWVFERDFGVKERFIQGRTMELYRRLVPDPESPKNPVKIKKAKNPDF